jgi:DNA-directed RNA polymerase subunit RPC12/RpoP
LSEEQETDMSEPVEKCPQCGSDRVTKGRILGGISSIYFRPSGLRFWTMKAAVPMIGANKTEDEFFPPGARACVNCGLLWSRVNHALLEQVLREGGTEETRKRFGGTGEEEG